MRHRSSPAFGRWPISLPRRTAPAPLLLLLSQLLSQAAALYRRHCHGTRAPLGGSPPGLVVGNGPRELPITSSSGSPLFRMARAWKTPSRAQP
uniref:Secreted protein n=1 Tax=Arundo donax TaxID=35708 RepID=A0A0A9DA27_ARUDO